MESENIKINELLANLLPTQNQLSILKESELWIQDTLSSGVSCKSFRVGAALNGMTLPGEPIEITQVFPKNQAVNWAVKTNETLVNETVKQHLIKPSIIDIDKIFVSVRSDCVESVINETKFTFTPNNSRGLFFSAIVEEIDHIVGAEGLFKRSVLLIKAWLTYESRKYSFQALSDIFTHESIVVLTMWLFASQSSGSAPIAHPLDALSAFLEVFSDDFEWESYSISAIGIESTKESSSPTTSPLKTNKALQRDALSREHEEDNLLRAQFAAVIDQYAERYDAKLLREKPRSSSASWMEDDNALQMQMQGNFDTQATVDLSDVMFRGNDRVTVQDPVMLGGEKNLLSHLFVDGSGVVVSPREITATLKKGYADILSYRSDVTRLMSITQSVLTARVPFVQSQHGEETPIPSASLVEILEMISYAEVTIVSKITAEMIIKLVGQVLQQNGPLPIGEIGKQLQTMTGNTNLPKIMRKEFSGLKNIISSSPHMFRFGDNHDFNPFVFLVQGEGVAGLTPPGGSGVKKSPSQQQLYQQQQHQSQGQMSRSPSHPQLHNGPLSKSPSSQQLYMQQHGGMKRSPSQQLLYQQQQHQQMRRTSQQSHLQQVQEQHNRQTVEAIFQLSQPSSLSSSPQHQQHIHSQLQATATEWPHPNTLLHQQPRDPVGYKNVNQNVSNRTTVPTYINFKPQHAQSVTFQQSQLGRTSLLSVEQLERDMHFLQQQQAARQLPQQQQYHEQQVNHLRPPYRHSRENLQQFHDQHVPQHSPQDNLFANNQGYSLWSTQPSSASQQSLKSNRSSGRISILGGVTDDEDNEWTHYDDY